MNAYDNGNRERLKGAGTVEEHLAVDEPERAVSVHDRESRGGCRLRDELEDSDMSGRTIQFSAARPLPATLVKRIVKARVRENEARAEV